MLDPINFNGQIIDGDTIGFNQLKRGFNFGDGLFETIRVFNGKIICLDAHFNRISSGLEVLKIKQNYSFNQNSLERYINELLLYKNIKYGEGQLTIRFMDKDHAIMFCLSYEGKEYETQT